MLVGIGDAPVFKVDLSEPVVLCVECLQTGRCADIVVLDETDEAFDMTDHMGNRVHSDIGYRCVLTVCDGQVIYRY